MGERHVYRGESVEQLVTFRLDDKDFGIPITQVYEIIFVPSISPIPKAPRSIIGVINLRGEIIPVIDLRIQFGQPAATYPSKRQRIVITVSQGKVIGLLVDEVTEVLRVSVESMEALPNSIATVDTEYIKAIYKLPQRIVILLYLDRILSFSEIEFIYKNVN
jgi:purine-binding chemotaxis protein CheW